MNEPPPVPSDKRVRFEFSGGPRDGEAVSSDGEEGRLSDQAISHADAFQMCWGLTNGGKVGAAFKGISPAALQQLISEGGESLKGSGIQSHCYLVVDRKESDASVLVLCKCVDEADLPNLRRHLGSP